MERHLLNEKEFLVLNYFIKNESRLSKDKDRIQKHFYTYPGKIEKELNGEISRVHAKEVCEKFRKMLILSLEEKTVSRKASGKKYYTINPDFEAFKKIIRLILDNANTDKVVEIFANHYIQSYIDRDLITKVLFENGVIFPRKLDISSWEKTEAKELFDDILKNKWVKLDIPHNEILRSGKSIKEYVKEMPDSDLISFELYMKRKIKEIYHNEETLSQMISFMGGSQRDLELVYAGRSNLNQTISDLEGSKKNQFYPVELTIDFPFLNISEESSFEEYIDEVEELNKQLFDKFQSLRKCYSAIKDHYIKWQEDYVIIPLLLLITASPRALDEFLNGNWKIDQFNLCENSSLGSFEPIIENLLFLTLGDLTSTYWYPKNSIINSFNIHPLIETIDGDKRSELLSLGIEGETKIIYFDRQYSITITPEGKTIAKSRVFSDRGITYSNRIIKNINGFVEKISNYSEIIEYLKDIERPVSRILANNFSSFCKNLLKYYDNSKEIPYYLEYMIKNEIRRTLLSEDWSELLLIGFGELSEDSRKKLDIHITIIKDPISKPDSILYSRIQTGKAILQDVFDKALSI